jgi:hypothetical protein
MIDESHLEAADPARPDIAVLIDRAQGSSWTILSLDSYSHHMVYLTVIIMMG